jgi:ubiquinone/menaquinone biosynthesis C-methylase UbiE
MADHRLFAAVYDRAMAPIERGGLTERRRHLLSRASGHVLELGAGTGANLALYPPAVTSVVALEPDGAMRRHLVDKVDTTSLPVEVHGDALPTAFPDATFDTVVTTLVLCTVPDPTVTLAEVRRVLKPDGTFLFLEHVAGTGWVSHLQRGVEPVWRHLAAGCHVSRDTVRAVEAAGFSIDDLERFRMPNAPRIVRPAVVGVAQ